MISEKQLPELNAYRKLEGLLPVECAPELDRLVVAGINEQLPVHRWFRFKESFSADLLKTVLASMHVEIGEKTCLVDPFCGAGTSLISAQELSRSTQISAIGIEQNPFIHFVLSTGRCMSRHNAMRLVSIRDAIRADGDSRTHDALLLGLGSVVEQVSKTRKDGRALRLVERDRQDIGRVLFEKWTQMASDVRFMKQVIPQAPVPTVLLGDGRAPSKHRIPPNSVDILLTSPPYPNNIDYTEVYKLELWLLGFISDADEFLKLRKGTFRSHPTAAAPNPSDEFSDELKKGTLKALLGPIIRRTRSSSERYRHRLIVGYASDLWSTLREHYALLKKEGICVMVLGNSLHGGKHLPYLIPSDLLVSAIGERTGYKVRKVAIARNFRRRLSGNHFLRESVIILEKE